ncbi:MAG: archaellin/type IV pilin N-terminal domain-containing protein [Dehalococcoidia bacterium]
MLRKNTSKKILRNEKGITGLETAIILIAFVVVASVFAYTVLSAGLFSSQKSQEAVHSGLRETRSTLEICGGIIAKSNSTNVTEIAFTLKKTMDGETIDFTDTSADNNVVVISYTDQYQRKDDLEWSKTWLGKSDGDVLMEDDEKVQISIQNLVDGETNGLDTPLQANTDFTLEVKPPQGAVMTLERKTPKSLDPVMNLD